MNKMTKVILEQITKLDDLLLFSKAFKVEVAKDIINELSMVGQVSKEYGITRPMVSRWVAEYKRYKNKAFTGRGKRLPDKAKLYTLEQENKRL